jgi:hypothetical protein
MAVSIAELGNSLRCPEKGCGAFGKIVRQKVTKENITIDFVCDKHSKKYSRKYSVNQFIRMAENILIDKEWIVDFQRKMIILTGQYIKIAKGLEGAYFTKNLKILQEVGPQLMCKCGSFASLTFVEVKGDKTVLNLYCNECMPKGKKLAYSSKALLELGRAGVIDNTLAQKIKDEYTVDKEPEFDTSDAYSVGKGIMAGWVQEDLGMMDEGGKVKRCYICGTTVSEAMEKCPKCGSDL